MCNSEHHEKGLPGPTAWRRLWGVPPCATLAALCPITSRREAPGQQRCSVCEVVSATMHDASRTKHRGAAVTPHSSAIAESYLTEPSPPRLGRAVQLNLVIREQRLPFEQRCSQALSLFAAEHHWNNLFGTIYQILSAFPMRVSLPSISHCNAAVSSVCSSTSPPRTCSARGVFKIANSSFEKV